MLHCTSVLHSDWLTKVCQACDASYMTHILHIKLMTSLLCILNCVAII